MCICLNCNYINTCKQYFFIEKNHNELNTNKNPYFNPTQSIISINYNGNIDQLLIEWDLEECLSFKEKPGNWLVYYNN